MITLNGKGTKVPGQTGPHIDTESEQAGQVGGWGPRVLYIPNWSMGSGGWARAWGCCGVSFLNAFCTAPLPGFVEPSATRSKQYKDGSQRSADQLSYLQCPRSVAASISCWPPLPAPVSMCLFGKGWSLPPQLLQDVLAVLIFAPLCSCPVWRGCPPGEVRAPSRAA